VEPRRFAERRRQLIEEKELRGPAFGRAYAALLDEWLASLLDESNDVALIACGGLGRREVAPESDLDLLIVHGASHAVTATADKIWYPVWDLRLRLDHSVRSVKEAVSVAREDLKTALTLLDGRVIAGDAELGDRVLAKVREAWVKDARRRLPALAAITDARHRQEGDVAYLLEPDLKQAKGGLRDVAVLRAMWAALALPNADSESLSQSLAVLFDARVELHRITGRSHDSLQLEAQDDVARRLELADADELMARVATAGRSIARASDDAWRRTRARLEGPRSRRSPVGDRQLGDGIVLRDQEVDIADRALPSDASLLLRVAEQAARLDAPIALRALHQLSCDAPALTHPWPAAARDAMIGLLGSGPPLITVMETLDEHGLVSRVLPEWDRVRSRPQRNAFHRFTVDRHLTEAAVQASALVDQVERPDLLVLGAWLHDLGKGWPGDHTDAGIRLVAEITKRMGVDPRDREILVALVRYHLLLPSIATSRDLDDPATIATVAGEVRTTEVLHLLAALTKADSLATGPSAWSEWKEELVVSLVHRVEDHLAGRDPARPAAEFSAEDEALAQEANGQLVVRHDGDLVTIVAPDQPGLLCNAVGLLTVHGGDVRSADVRSTDTGVAVDRLSVVPSLPNAGIDWDALSSELDTLVQPEALDERVEERTRLYRRRAESAHDPAPVVTAHPPEVSSSSLVLEVRARDTIGLLYRILRAITACGLDIRRAMVSTLGQEVVDTFYVQTVDGDRPDDPKSRQLVRTVGDAVRGEPDGRVKNA
jgi:[protein-PII] uridylyltransferase